MYEHHSRLKTHLTIVTVIAGFLSVSNASELPPRIKVSKESGIIIRESLDKGAKAIGRAFNTYSYNVQAGRAAYFRIALPNGIKGWIFSSLTRPTVERIGKSQIRVVAKNGLPLRPTPYKTSLPSLGTAATDYTFDIIEVRYSHLKIKTRNGLTGWIYAGPNDNRWVSYKFDKETPLIPAKAPHPYANFGQNPSGTMTINGTETETYAENNTTFMRLNKPNKSRLTANFTLPKRPDQAVLILNHKSTYLSTGQHHGISPISIHVNGSVVAQALEPGAHDFVECRLPISKYIKAGPNTIQIQLEKASSDYGIKSIKIEPIDTFASPIL